MPHRFDSGLAAPIRARVREAILAALLPLTRGSGLYVATVVQLPTTFRFATEDDERLFDDLVAGNSPAIGVGLGRQTFRKGTGTGGRSWLGDLEVGIYVGVKHARSVLAGLAGDVASSANVTKDPGVETVLEHCFERLAGLQTGIDAAPRLVPDAEDPIYYGAGWQVWEQTYRVAVELALNPQRDNTARVTDVQVDHRIEGSDAQPVTTITVLEMTA